MSDFSTLIRDAEAQAKLRGLSVNELCKLADVHRATWQRWKAGRVGPTLRKWRSVQAVLQRRAEKVQPSATGAI